MKEVTKFENSMIQGHGKEHLKTYPLEGHKYIIYTGNNIKDCWHFIYDDVTKELNYVTEELYDIHKNEMICNFVYPKNMYQDLLKRIEHIENDQ